MRITWDSGVRCFPWNVIRSMIRFAPDGSCYALNVGILDRISGRDVGNGVSGQGSLSSAAGLKKETLTVQLAGETT
jgi:hypothetical protein